MCVHILEILIYFYNFEICLREELLGHVIFWYLTYLITGGWFPNGCTLSYFKQPCQEESQCDAFLYYIIMNHTDLLGWWWE